MRGIVARHGEIVRQFFKFGIVGLVGFIVDWGMLHFALDILMLNKTVDAAANARGIHVNGIGLMAAGLFSFPFAVTVTWIGNRLFTFRHAGHDPAAKQLAKFAAVCAVGLVFNRGTYSLLVHFAPLASHYPVLGLLGGTCAGMFFNFFAARRHVFKA
jgi:putative flippase GtrA